MKHRMTPQGREIALLLWSCVALFAARVLALSDRDLAARLTRFRETQSAKVLEKDAALQKRLSGAR